MKTFYKKGRPETQTLVSRETGVGRAMGRKVRMQNVAIETGLRFAGYAPETDQQASVSFKFLCRAINKIERNIGHAGERVAVRTALRPQQWLYLWIVLFFVLTCQRSGMACDHLSQPRLHVLGRDHDQPDRPRTRVRVPRGVAERRKTTNLRVTHNRGNCNRQYPVEGTMPNMTLCVGVSQLDHPTIANVHDPYRLRRAISSCKAYIMKNISNSNSSRFPAVVAKDWFASIAALYAVAKSSSDSAETARVT